MSKKTQTWYKLKAVRVEHGETQSDLAKVLNIAEPTYNKKELGHRDFTLSEAIIIAKHYNKTLDEIFFTNHVNTNETNNQENAHN